MKQEQNRQRCSPNWIVNWVTVCLLVGTGMGCSPMTSNWKMKDWQTPNLMPKKEEKPELPGRVMSIWTDAIHHKQGEPAERGFGGRIVFYNESKTDPIQVDGTLTIYAFSDEDGNQSKQPEKRFVFSPEQLKQHYSRCSLGDSYSVWLPWDEVGGPSRQVSLITRFDGINGGTVMSDPARKLLPGTNPENLTTLTSNEGTLPRGAVELSSSKGSQNRSPVKNLFEDNTESEKGKISLASFVAETPSSSDLGGSSKVETVDLNDAAKMSQTQTFAVPTSLGMRRFDSQTFDRQNGGGSYSNEQANGTPENSRVVDASALAANDEIAKPRVEKQSGATVYYGKPGQAIKDRETILAEATSSAGSDPRFQNYQADSLRLREDQLGQVKDARQQFRSEPWRFPVRTQAITRPARVDAGY